MGSGEAQLEGAMGAAATAAETLSGLGAIVMLQLEYGFFFAFYL